MKEYTNKKELISAIKSKYELYIREFADIPETKKNLRIDEADRTPSENLSYQLGWINLLLDWERREKQGKTVQTPAEGYKWNELGGLYQSFYEKYGQMTLLEQQEALLNGVEELCRWIDSLSDIELFEPEQRGWATTKAKWPLYKWIHINTVAPFTSFRTKIRKWKKYTL
ncbi:ClbS/DfsB family four-helix bundle protein [Enterococcus sp. CWB-B31]|uniref:ClbS/DfsB family four-helix bundle protein n=1 Tax=Enterococcus sp. CWB-B31 TaxID=2885159 RepID=UPI001E5C1B4F|nr:ClbS/DfsB family four-helix bundle protein [Enterococcus sp. CWB-B31]MCB5953840.1 ClbS/DfsB family four-helix bundle protein [Enterococcus sp. CWB-B31]